MMFRSQVVAAAAILVACITSTSAQAPLAEKNVSMKMALAIIDAGQNRI